MDKKDDPSGIWVRLPENSSINDKIIEELDDLFLMTPPSILRKSLTEIFFSYLCNTKSEDYKPELNKIASDFYFLIKFLEEAEQIKR
jgi:hypothetical protein